MSFLGKALTVVGAIVGIAAAVATGGTLGLLAGAFIAVGAAANLGIIGGSIGKFMNSGIGRGLLAAVSLGSAAYAMYGSTALQAGTQQVAAQSAAEMHATVGTTLASDANAIGTDAALTNSSFLNSANMGQEVAQLQAADPALASVGGVSPQSLQALNNATIAGPSLGANASQAAQAATSTDTAAVNPLANTSASNALTPGGGPGMPGTKPLMAGQDAGAGGGVTPGTPAAEVTVPPAAGADAGPYQVPDSAAGAPPSMGSRVGGLLNNAIGLVDKHPGLAQVGMGAVSGIGQGISSSSQLNEYLKQQQWGNMQWNNQGQIDKLQAAAAQPITVPQGYLQRAAQVRTLMQGSQGMQPLPTAQPGAPLAPSPVKI